jgi:hypothetical protein
MSYQAFILKTIVELSNKNLQSTEIRINLYNSFINLLEKRLKISTASKVNSKLKDTELQVDKNDLEFIKTFKSILKFSSYLQFILIILFIVILTLFLNLFFTIQINLIITIFAFLLIIPSIIKLQNSLDAYLECTAKMIRRKNYFDHSHRLRSWVENDLVFFQYLDNESFYPMVGKNTNLIFTLDCLGNFTNHNNGIIFSKDSEFKALGEILLNFVQYDRIKIE